MSQAEHRPGPDWICTCGYDYFGGSAGYSWQLYEAHVRSVVMNDDQRDELCFCGAVHDTQTPEDNQRLQEACDDYARKVSLMLREAWTRGMHTGSSRAMRHMSDEPNLPLASENDNPYKEFQ